MTGLAIPWPPASFSTIAQLRRQKDADEIDVLRRCMRATEAGHAWARANVKPGMTELDVYSRRQRGLHPGRRPAGDRLWRLRRLARARAPRRRPTDRVLKPGDMFILDFSVVHRRLPQRFHQHARRRQGSRRRSRQRLYDLCMAAMAAGESELRAGARA